MRTCEGHAALVDEPDGAEVRVGVGRGRAAVLVTIVEVPLRDLGSQSHVQPPHSLFQKVSLAETKKKYENM